jgi:hypothetical protein
LQSARFMPAQNLLEQRRNLLKQANWMSPADKDADSA